MRDHRTEWILKFTLTGATNSFMIPGIFEAWKRQHLFELVVGFFTIVTSSIYHVTQALESSFLGNDGRWHQADNIFATSMFMLLIINFAQVEDARIDQLVRITSLCVAATAQCLMPWDIMYTLVPIFGALGFTVAYRVYKWRLPVINSTKFVLAVCFCCIAMICFILGLDDDNDYLRLFHGLWHLFVSVFGYCALDCAIIPPKAVKTAKIC